MLSCNATQPLVTYHPPHTIGMYLAVQRKIKSLDLAAFDHKQSIYRHVSIVKHISSTKTIEVTKLTLFDHLQDIGTERCDSLTQCPHLSFTHRRRASQTTTYLTDQTKLKRLRRASRSTDPR